MGGDKNLTLWRNFNLTILSAEDLPDVRNHSQKTRAYAEVSISGTGSKKSIIKSKTKPDKLNGLDPVWNCSKEFWISNSSVNHSGLTVVIKVYTERTLGDRYIGEVHTTIKDLYDNAVANGGSAKQSLPINLTSKRGSDSSVLNFSYTFGDTFSIEKGNSLETAVKIGLLVASVTTTAAGVGHIVAGVIHIAHGSPIIGVVHIAHGIPPLVKLLQ